MIGERGDDGHEHRWRFHEIEQPGFPMTRVEHRCSICGAVAGPMTGDLLLDGDLRRAILRGILRELDRRKLLDLDERLLLAVDLLTSVADEVDARSAGRRLPSTST